MEISKLVYLLLLRGVPPVKVNDSNTALHLLPPEYKVPYGPQKTEDITSVLNPLFTFLDAATPAKLIDNQSKAEIKRQQQQFLRTVLLTP